MWKPPIAFQELLAGFGITTMAAPGARDGRDADLRLGRGASEQDYTCKAMTKVRFAEVARSDRGNLPLLVLTSYLPSKTADALRRAGIQYLDRAGNAWIEFGDVLIDVRGRSKPPDYDEPTQRVGNLLSPRRSQVLFVLLAWPELWHAPRRDIAHAAGVSIGQAHSTMTLLNELEYHDGAARPGRAQLLDLWTASFPTGLAPQLTLGNFHGEIDGVKPADSKDHIVVSGERAAEDLIRPATLIIYVEELKPRLPIVNRWRADGPPNITVRRKFWRAPNGTDDLLPAVDVAPWPLVYADLASSDDPRVSAAATEWRDRHVRPERRTP